MSATLNSNSRTNIDRRLLLARALEKARQRQNAVPLSFAQQRLWFLDQLLPNTGLYNLPVCCRIYGSLNRGALENAYAGIVARHDALRTRFLNTEEGPVQLVQGDGGSTVNYVDLRSLDTTERLAAEQKLIREEALRPFDLSEGPLIRASLIQVAAEEWVFLVTAHHIVSDEWSIKVFFNELSVLYASHLEGLCPALPELPIQYPDFAAWQRASLPAQVLESQLNFWKGQLSDCPLATEWQGDRPHPATPTFKGATEHACLPVSLAESLRALGTRERSTLFMTLLAAFKALMFRYTGQADLVIGAPIAGRNRPEIEPLIGFFVNTLPLRTKFQPNHTFTDLLGMVREATLGAFAHQDLPFEKIVEALHPDRSLHHIPFTRLMFVLQNSYQPSLPGLRLELEEVEGEWSKFDITLGVQEAPDGLRLRCEYSTDLYDGATIRRMLGHYGQLLSSIVESPNRRLLELPLLTPDERNQAITVWNKTRTEYPRRSCVHQLFEAQVAATPNAEATTHLALSLSYAELNARANQLAWHLKSLGVSAEVPVAIAMLRGTDLVIALLAILKAGGAYVPIDPAYPRERVTFILRDTAAPILLTQQSLLNELPCDLTKVLCTDADWSFIAQESKANPPCVTTPESLAYIMYTSGSTGTPKGVAVPHRAICRLVRNSNYIQFTQSDRVAQVANVAFDASTLEIWGALLNGGCLAMIPQDAALSPKDFARELRQNGVTAMFLTTGLFNQVAADVPSAFQGLDTLIVGGEALDAKWVRAVLESAPPRRLLNGYGPTENTTFTTWHHITHVPTGARSVPIGQPISNTTVYVLDDAMNPVPVGVPGELYTGGDGLARGYWNRPELTQARFVVNPFSDSPGDRLYKTGDIVKRLADGSIEYIGRVDGQVKLRGFRIELGEIEAHLKSHPEVRDCAVAVSESSGGLKRLTAYVVPANGSAPNVSQLRSYLAGRLPDYMLPTAFMPLETLPLTPNGKLDRRALPAPDGLRPELDRKYTPPRNETEHKLAGIMEKVLKVTPVGIRDNFFELGGHSLLAIRAVSLIEKEFGRKIRVATLFQAPTVDQLAAILDREEKEPEPKPETSLVEIRAEGKGPALFLVHGAGGGMFWGYVNLAKHLDGPVYGFKSRGLDGLDEYDRMEDLAAQYVKDMRRQQPHGPYHLGGYCFGGNVAFEMARQLRAAGEEVALLALMNCAPPNSSYTRIPWTPSWGLRLAKNMKYWASYFRSWTPSQRRDFFKWKFHVLRRRFSVWRKFGLDRRAPIEATNLVDLSSYTAEQQKVWEAHIRALVGFHPQPFDGKVKLFRSPGHPLWCSFTDDYGWGELARGGVEVHIVPAAHERILEEPHAQEVAEVLKGSLPAEISKVESGTSTNNTMAVLQGVIARATLLWCGAEGGLLEVVAPHLENGNFSLASVFAHLGVVGIGAASGRSATRPVEASSDTLCAQPSELAVQNIALEPELRRHLETFSRAEHVPLSLTLLAAAKVLFYRRSVSGGNPFLEAAKGPENNEAQPVLCEVNDLVLRAEFNSSTPFRAVLRQLQPFAEQSTGLKATVLKASVGSATSSQAPDLCFEFDASGESIVVELRYNPNWLDETTGNVLITSFKALLEAIAEDPSRTVADLPMLTAQDRQRLSGGCQLGAASPFQESYVEHFVRAVDASPEAVAARVADKELTYRELDERANQVAHYLQKRRVGVEDLVGVCLDRSVDLTITLLGIWKTGAAYLPLDPNYPRERLAYMLQDSGARLVISQERFLSRLGLSRETAVCVDETAVIRELSAQPKSRPAHNAGGQNLAYVMYTSGSTGNPKGVQIEHHSLLNHNLAMAETFQLTSSDRVLQFSPLSFDISIEEIFPTLLTGARLVLRPEDLTSSTDRFLDFVEREGITILDLPTAYWHELVEAVQRRPLPASVRCVVIGGEKASDVAFQRWSQAVSTKVMLVNTYGPTETTVTTTYYVAQQGSQRFPIGKPLKNAYVVLLDENLSPVPTGMTGELYIGGEGVARGYLNRPELTAQKFVPNPLTSEFPGLRLYRTGDLARYADDGNLEFVGRADQQVKYRGYRIELGEIETALRGHPQVKEAVVAMREDQPGRKRLVGYVVNRDRGETVPQELRSHLRERLPEYMVPTHFVNLAELPLTPAGKIDRRSLPAPGNERPDLDVPYAAPRTPLEVVLCRIWSEVLGLAKVGVHDNFFELGGHSLVATRLASRMREALSTEVPLADVYECPTIAELARSITVSTRSPVLPWSTLASGPLHPLTRAQQHIWVLDQFDPTCSCYNVYQMFAMTGRLDQARLAQAFKLIAERHEAARSIFPEINGTPVRVVWPNTDVPLNILDFRALAEHQREGKALEALAAQARSSHVTISPALRVVLARISDERHLLLVVLHELVADRDSLKTLCRELFAHYESEDHCEHAKSDEFTALLERQAQTEDAAIGRIADYALRFKDVAECLELPADRPRPASRTDNGGKCPIHLAGLRADMERFAAEAGLQPSTVLQAAFAAVLFRYSRTSCFVMGSAVSLRDESTQGTLGPLNEIAPFRCDLSGTPTFLDLCLRLHREAQEIRSEGLIPFACLVQNAGVKRNASHTPLFQVQFDFEEQPLQTVQARELTFQPVELDSGTARLDLLMHARFAEDAVEGYVEFSSDLFEQDRVARLTAHLETLLRDALANPSEALSNLALLPNVERLQLEAWNETARPFPHEKTLAQMVWDQAAKTPDSEALVSGSERLTYLQLVSRAEAFARVLRNAGLRRGDLVGVCLERGTDLLVAILGILRTGAAYVPLDPKYPKERLKLILEDCKARLVVTQGEPRKLVEALAAVPTVAVSGPVAPPSRQMVEAEIARPDDIAYIIYTSGSTGIPKGVMIEHRSAVALVAWAHECFTAEELAGVLASTSICFDLSIFEMFVPLTCGAKVIMAENALALAELPSASEVTLINTVPSAITELLGLKAVPSSTRVINLAGEPLAAQLADRIYAETSVSRVFDLYGPTETTTYSTAAHREVGKPAFIGKPLPNEEVWLLDENSQLVPIGVPGEVCIGGIGVARGYLNRPELTSERFISNPLKPSQQLYRTGDLARWRADGNLEYLGRRDFQVKIRGYRIELGEIEAALRSFPGVKEAVVAARDDGGGKRLFGYVVVEEGKEAKPEALRQHLRSSLPEHMVPSALVELSALPLTPNGKVDRKALPVPRTTSQARAEQLKLTPTEQTVAEIWREVLGHIPEPETHFFESGGDSLLAIRVLSRLRERLGAEIPLALIFSKPVLRDLACSLEGLQGSAHVDSVAVSRVDRNRPLPASFVQERLWILHEITPESDAYNVPAAVRIRGMLDVAKLQGALSQVQAAHEPLRTTLHLDGSEVIQKIHAPGEFVLPIVELPVAGEGDDVNLQSALQAEASRPFNLGAGPLIRAKLFRIGAEDHVLMVVLHHAITDGWSVSLLLTQIAEEYNRSSNRQELSPASAGLQYADYATWQRQWMSGARLAQALDYWKQHLLEAPQSTSLPTDDLGAAPQESNRPRMGRKTLRITGADRDAILAFTHSEGSTLFTMLLAALNVTLYQWTAQSDLVTGTVVAGRSRREFENLLGCFMNFVPLRVKLSPQSTVREYLARVRQVTLDAQSHQECPFEKIVEAVNPERDKDQNPLYNVALLLQNFPREVFSGEGFQATTVPVTVGDPLLDLRFEAEDTSSGLEVHCEYKRSMFSDATIEALADSYAGILIQMARQRDASLGTLNILPALRDQAEASARRTRKRQFRLVSTFTAEPIEESLKHWLQEIQLPGVIEFAGYNQVFQELLDPGSSLNRNSYGVNVCLLRLEDWAKASGTGDAALGREQVRKTAREFTAALTGAASSGAVPWIVLFGKPSPRWLQQPGNSRFTDDLENQLAGELNQINAVHAMTSAQVAMLYPVSDYADAAAEDLGHVPYTPLYFTALGTTIARKLHALSRPAYKAIILDCDNTLWGGVCGEDGPEGIRVDGAYRALQEFLVRQHDSGRLLCLCSKNNPEDVEAVFAKRTDMPLTRKHITAVRLNWVPKSENLKSLATELNLGLDSFIFLDDNPVECAGVEASCPRVLTLQLPENAAQIEPFLKHCWAFDTLKVTKEDLSRAESYRKNAERDALRKQAPSLSEFIANLNLNISISDVTEHDIGRVAQLTQRTNQFNCTTIRRNEAEVRILQANARVLCVRVSDRFGDYGLVGVAVVKTTKEAVDVDTLLLSCRVLGRGVEHRVIAHIGEWALQEKRKWVDVHFSTSAKNKPAWDFLEGIGAGFKQAQNGGYLFRFPAGYAAEVAFNPSEIETGDSGRVSETKAVKGAEQQAPNLQYKELALRCSDLEALHQRVHGRVTKSNSRAPYVPPQTSLQKQICEVWQEVLRVERVGIMDNFFELGGHSLLAVRLFAQLDKVTGIKLPLVTLFQAPTVQQLASHLSPSRKNEAESLLVPIQGEGTKPPLFLVHGAGGDVLWGYANLAGHLGEDQPVYGIKSRVHTHGHSETLEQMARTYVSHLRAFQPTGPYYLGGYCFGGNVAFEMARQLEGEGQKVALVALLDSAPSNAGYETVTWWKPAFAPRFVRNLSYWLSDFSRLPADQRRRFVSRKAKSTLRKVAAKFGFRSSANEVDLDEVIDVTHFPENELKLWQSHLQALVTHTDQSYGGRVMLLRTRGQPVLCSLEPDFCWKRLAPKLEVCLVSGSHEQIFMEPHVQELARSLRAALETAQAQLGISANHKKAA